MFFVAVSYSTKNAAEVFQSYIDISLHLLSGSGSSSSIGVLGGSLATSDTVDLASAYNLLGLALRDSGRDLIATKKAFLEGLSVAPDNFALLVNGGVAHQARQIKQRHAYDPPRTRWDALFNNEYEWAFWLVFGAKMNWPYLRARQYLNYY